jgi:hypothetical protein
MKTIKAKKSTKKTISRKPLTPAVAFAKLKIKNKSKELKDTNIVAVEKYMRLNARAELYKLIYQSNRWKVIRLSDSRFYDPIAIETLADWLAGDELKKLGIESPVNDNPKEAKIEREITIKWERFVFGRKFKTFSNYYDTEFDS